MIEEAAALPLPVIPAVDVLGFEAVRLVRGEYDRVGARAGDPLALVRRFAAARPPAIHFVDLLAARDGGVRPELVAAAVEAAGAVPLQVAGGVRSVEDARALATAGAARVVVGTAALTGDVAPYAAELGERLVVAIDARGDEAVVAGWERGSGLSVNDALARCVRAGVETVMCTATERDGTLAGPDLLLLARVRDAWPGVLLAAGGIRGPADLASLAEVGVDGAVVGRALLAND